jgi:AraC-like DNA-binding protein
VVGNLLYLSSFSVDLMYNTVLYPFAIFTLAMISLLVTFKRRPQVNDAGKFLSLYYWFYTLSVSIVYLVQTPYLVYVPHLFRTAQFFILPVLPLSYLYFRQSLLKKPLTWFDLIHLLPLLIFVVDYAPFFWLPASKKIEIWHGLSDYTLNAAFREGWFMPEGGHVVMRYLVMFTYWVLQFRMLYALSPDRKEDINWENPRQLTWFRWLLWTQLGFILPSLLVLVFAPKSVLGISFALTALLSALLQGYYLFTHPDILYGIRSVPEPTLLQTINRMDNRASGQYSPPATPVEESPATYLDQVDDTLLDRIEAALEPLMNRDRIFLNPQLKVADLATASGFGPHKLAAYFNKRCDKTFNDYINERRVDHCAEKLASGEYRSKTLEALSLESGFQSRSTFIRAFKKRKGKTPSEFVRDLQA